MRILYIHQYFCTRAGRSGTRSYEFARYLVGRGHQVTMLTSDSDLSDMRLPVGKRRANFEIDGLQGVVVRASYSQKMGAMGRIQSFLRFMALSSWIACRLPRHDVIVATSTPLTVGVPGLLASLVHRTPLVFEVRDLWPEAPIQMGVIRNPILVWLLRAFERTIYRRSAHVIALSPGMRDGVVAVGTPQRKVTVIPNCSDIDLFRPGDPQPDIVARYGLQNRFVVGYAGSMGEANDVDTLLEAAVQWRDRDDLRFFLIGDGKQAKALRERVQALGLSHVVFAGSLPRREVADVLQACHVCLVLFKDLPVLATNSPNKLFDALAAGRPVIVNSGGWTRELVEKHNVGLYAPPSSRQSLAKAIAWLQAHPEERARMGLEARRLAETDFNRMRLAAKFEETLLAVVARPQPSTRVADQHTRACGALADVRPDKIDTGGNALTAGGAQVPGQTSATGGQGERREVAYGATSHVVHDDVAESSHRR